MPRVEVADHVDAPLDVVRAAVAQMLGAAEAESVEEMPGAESPGALSSGTASFEATLARGLVTTVEVKQDDGRTAVSASADVDLDIPYFRWAVEPLIVAGARRELESALERIGAHVAGIEPPKPPKPVPLAPTVPYSPAEATFLATIAMCAAMTSFGASLASQNVQFVARAFGVDDARLGVALAASRAGVLIGLVLSAFADRRGRRRMLLFAVSGVCAGSAVCAVSPDLVVFTAGQVLVRGFANAAFAIAAIAAVEEAPEGGRAYTVSMLTLAGGAGYFPGLVLVSVGDLGPHTWRIAFALCASSLALMPGIARRLHETTRYTELAARSGSRGRVLEVLDRTYGRRFVVLVAVTFLGAIFAAPGAQFQNRYLAEVRGFSGVDITLFVMATGFPGIVGLVLGGRLAETHGRRPVAAWGLLATTVLQMAFFVVGGPLMWLVSLGSSLAGGMLAPVLGALGAEMFATEIRGTANGMLIVAGVAGAAVGLVGAGALASELGGIGNAIALAGVAALLVVPLVPLLPESAFRRLEDVSPSEV